MKQNHQQEAVTAKTAFAQLRIEKIACVLSLLTLKKKKNKRKLFVTFYVSL